MTLAVFLLLATLSVPFALGCRDLVIWLVDLDDARRRRKRDRMRRGRLGLARRLP